FYDDLGMPPMWLHRLLRRLGNATTVAPSTSTTTRECRQCGYIYFYDDLRIPLPWHHRLQRVNFTLSRISSYVHDSKACYIREVWHLLLVFTTLENLRRTWSKRLT
ncbi:hypothetical protein AVEN_77196-1, partial [Araneus ventricosus]